MSVKTNVVKLFTDHGWFELNVKDEKQLKDMITDYMSDGDSVFEFSGMFSEDKVKTIIRMMIVNGNEIEKGRVSQDK